MFQFWKRTLWLVADDPEQTWWCNCRRGIVDAPWHNKETFPSGGNGYLWSCAKCSRTFMFAKGGYIRGTFEKLASQCTPRTQRVIMPDGTIQENTLLDTAEDWLNLVRPLADKVKFNERYVFLDGHILPAKHGPVKVEGLFRSHEFPDLPHLSDAVMEETLANPDYWRR